jgi:hypothetical protein
LVLTYKYTGFPTVLLSVHGEKFLNISFFTKILVMVMPKKKKEGKERGKEGREEMIGLL